MDFKKILLAILCLVMSVAFVITGGYAAYYYVQDANAEAKLNSLEDATISVSICIDYQKYNGSVFWYNNTLLPIGSYMIDLLYAVTDSVALQDYGQKDYFVHGINGVNDEEWSAGAYVYQAPTDSFIYWMWHYWDEDTQKWEYGPTGASIYLLSNGEIVRWRFEVPSGYFSGEGP